MKTYVAEIIPRIQRFSKRLDDLTKLTSQHWVSLGDIDQSKRVYIFRPNNQLLISENGIVEKGSWEYLGNQSLLIETKHESYLLKHGFFDENVIALKLDGTGADNYTFFINETKYHDELNTIDDILKFLENKYLTQNKANLGSAKKHTTISEKYSYSIINKKKVFNFEYGSHIIYDIEFMNGIRGKVYQGKSTNKYFYFNDFEGVVYFQNFEDAAYKLFLSLRSQNNR